MDKDVALTEQPECTADLNYILSVWWALPTDQADFRRALSVAWRLGRCIGIDYASKLLQEDPDHAS